MVEQRKPMADYYNSWKFTEGGACKKCLGDIFSDRARRRAGLDSLSQGAQRIGKETGLYYFGARYYQPSWSIPALSQVEGWLSLDPLAEKYPSLSPFAYVANNPINAIDPDGRVIIFINGMHGGSGGKVDYWGGLDNKIMNRVGDEHARYYDGSSGGVGNTLTVHLGINNLFSGGRKKAGKIMGYNHAEAIFDELDDGETIKLVTHSMGASFGKGFIKGFKKYAEDNDIEIDGLIEFEIDLAPFQPDKQKADDDVPTKTISHKGDPVAGTKPMDGANNVIERKGKKSSIFEHLLESFSKDEINKHFPKSNNNREGSSTWEQNR